MLSTGDFMVKLIGKNLYQWDVGRLLEIKCSENINEVHFSQTGDTEALVVEPKDVDGMLVASIPNILLQQTTTLHVYLVVDNVTVLHRTFNISKREKPSDYVYTETEVKNYEALEKRIETLEKNGASDEVIESVIKDYLEENPIETGATKEQIEQIEKNTQDIAYKANVIVDSADGNNIVLTDSANEKPRGMKLFGKSEQTTISGKNLCKVILKDQTISGITFTVNADKSITLNGTCTQAIYMDMGVALLEGGVEYKISGCPKFDAWKDGGFYVNYTPASGNVWNRENEVAFVMTDTQEYQCAIHIRKDLVLTNCTFYPMVRLSSNTDTSYEPYTGGIPSPNPQYPQDIHSVGDGGSVEVKVDLQTLAVPTPNGLRGIKVSDSSLANYTDADGNMWCCDEIDLERGKYVQRVAEVSFTGNETWSMGSDARQENQRFRCDSVVLNDAYYNEFNTSCMSNISYGRSWYELYMDCKTNTATIQINRCVNFLYEPNTFADLEDWKQYVSENPVTVRYILATPIETDLADITLPTMNYPTTTLISDAHLHVDYVADTKGYIDKKFAELAKAIV